MKLPVDELDGRAQKCLAVDSELNDAVKARGQPGIDMEGARAATLKMVEMEKACRADTKCLAARALSEQTASLANDLCRAEGNLEVAQHAIQLENSNPSGVRDLAELHSDGEIIQQARADIAKDQAAYQKLTAKKFDLMGGCTHPKPLY